MGELLCIIPGPTHVCTLLNDQEVRWCFRCRKRTLHRWACLDDLEPSYYEPVFSQRCSDCNGDYTRFPGC